MFTSSPYNLSGNIITRLSHFVEVQWRQWWLWRTGNNYDEGNVIDQEHDNDVIVQEHDDDLEHDDDVIDQDHDVDDIDQEHDAVIDQEHDDDVIDQERDVCAAGAGDWVKRQIHGQWVYTRPSWLHCMRTCLRSSTYMRM